MENIVFHFRRIPKKCYFSQTGACIEAPSPDTGNAVRDRNTRQAGTVTEGSSSDAGNAIRYRDGC